MHNGYINDWHLVKRKLALSLPEAAYLTVQGGTGSVLGLVHSSVVPSYTSVRLRMVFCAVFVQGLDLVTRDSIPLIRVQLPNMDAETFPLEVLKKAMLDTISSLNTFAEEAGVPQPSLLNFCITDGECVIATRYVSSRQDEAASMVCFLCSFLPNPRV
jgi:glutamine amidotransferase